MLILTLDQINILTAQAMKAQRRGEGAVRDITVLDTLNIINKHMKYNQESKFHTKQTQLSFLLSIY